MLSKKEERSLGSSINDVRPFFRIYDPPLPLSAQVKKKAYVGNRLGGGTPPPFPSEETSFMDDPFRVFSKSMATFSMVQGIS